MEVQDDFRELLELFNDHSVEYVIIGGYALAFHGAPRFTGDMDIYVKPDQENAQRIVEALSAFGFGSTDILSEDFATEDKVVRLGVAPVRVDLVTSVTGVSWDDVWNGRASGSYGDVTVYYMGKREFVVNKRAIGRAKDIADIEALGEKALLPTGG